MEKDIWGGSWSPEIESRVANSIWEEKYRVSFELIDSSEERISFLKKLIRKTEEEREKLLKEYPEMSPEESEALIEGDRSVDLINFKKRFQTGKTRYFKLLIAVSSCLLET